MGAVVVATLCDGKEGEPLRAPRAALPLTLTPRTRGFPLRDRHLSKNSTPMRLATEEEVMSVRVTSASTKARAG